MERAADGDTIQACGQRIEPLASPSHEMDRILAFTKAIARPI